MKAAVTNVAQKVTESKWMMWSLLGFGIILLILSLFIGGDSAPVTTSTQTTQGESLPVDPIPVTNDIVVTQGENPLSDIWQWAFSEENRWIVSIAVVVALIAVTISLMRYSGVSAGSLGRTSITVIGYLVLGVMIVLFRLLPSGIIVSLSGIIMLILGGMVLLSLLMWVTGWGNRLAWFILLLGFSTLMYKPVESTAADVSETAQTIQEDGLQGVAPDLVPDFIYTSPEERETARREEAAQRVIDAEAERQRMINEAVAQAAAEAEAAKYRPLTADAFTTRTAGEFEPLQIRSGTRIGPINMYAACDTRWTKTGIGMIRILTRPDETSEPVDAIMTDRGYGIKETGHEGLPAQMFFEAVQGDIQIELVRFDNGTNLDNPC